MKLVYIFRAKDKAYSIERVFKPIMNILDKRNDITVKQSNAEVRGGFFSTHFANIKKYSALSRSGCICHITCEVRYCAIFMRRSRTILTTHDVMSIINSSAPWYSRLYSYIFQFYIPLRYLKYLTCVSESTKNELVKLFPWVENKLRVINNPVDSDFKFSKKEFNTELPTILHIGTKHNKNLLRVIKALKGINCHLRIIGKLSETQLAELHQSNIQFSNVYNISDEQIVSEYEKCDILSFPSLFEGFGMPIVEAQAVGRPVLTSNREPMAYVAGTGAVLVDPDDVAQIRNGFLLLINDANVREKCILNGLENVKKYRVETVTEQYLELYNELEINLP